MKYLLPFSIVCILLSSILLVDMLLPVRLSSEQKIEESKRMLSKNKRGNVYLDGVKITFENNNRVFLTPRHRLREGATAKVFKSPILRITRKIVFLEQEIFTQKTIYNSWRKAVIWAWWIVSLLLSLHAYKQILNKEIEMRLIVLSFFLPVSLCLYYLITTNLPY